MHAVRGDSCACLTSSGRGRSGRCIKGSRVETSARMSRERAAMQLTRMEQCILEEKSDESLRSRVGE